ncbi:MAG: hypothetical protein KAS04_01105 [Candidatus Aenigmarchaeota archaeon]|nr:hypothetical protein [Candidatus Aenigmarchaeota archaeon]
MKPEIIIKNWLLAWFKPEKVTEYNTVERVRQSLTKDNFGAFIEMFRDEGSNQIFTDDEKITLKSIILQPLEFGTGYPRNQNEPIKVSTIYIIEGGWQQQSTYIGSQFWHGKMTTHIVIVGRTAGDVLNMSEPTLLRQSVTSLLLSGLNYFEANHMSDMTINEILYGADEANSHEKGFSMRTLSMTYDAHRNGVITDDQKG